MGSQPHELKRISDYLWEIPQRGNMRVPGRIYASSALMPHIESDQSPLQVANVAHLPGIVKYSFAMPDIHWGYGFPIGGVAAFNMEEGIISPGGVGYDINCGCRLARTNLKSNEVKGKIKPLIQRLFSTVPCGVGSSGAISKLTPTELKDALVKGARWPVEKGFGERGDLEHIESYGAMKEADPDKVSHRAIERGLEQMGTLGSGNHFLEIDVIDEIYDEEVAEVFGLFKEQIVVLIHSGSRGLGYQICDDYLKVMLHAVNKYKLSLPDRQLACAPVGSPEGRNYFAAMACAANYAWANRQVIMALTKKCFEQQFRLSPRELGFQLIYDVCHNIAKMEEHTVDGKRLRVCVHRKGATRAFPPGHPDTPRVYSKVGQPVLIPGDMGDCSFVCVGSEGAMQKTFGSTCHGAGRVMSRAKAVKSSIGRPIQRELEAKGIYVLAKSKRTLAEEIPEAYKDVAEVVEVMHRAGVSPKVARLRPIGGIKG
ncbi:MAG: RtcB family protein [Acidobacteriota bacterium]